MTEPIELQEGMVFALETYCPASDGFSAARIEEEVVVTSQGPQILTLFPAHELFIAMQDLDVPVRSIQAEPLPIPDQPGGVLHPHDGR
jgi:hypothetical protein